MLSELIIFLIDKSSQISVFDHHFLKISFQKSIYSKSKHNLFNINNKLLLSYTYVKRLILGTIIPYYST